VSSVLTICLPLLVFGAQVPPRDGANTVEAFIPFLTPIEKVRPLWPDAAITEGVQGNVEMLVTIDTQGHVTKIEAWTGPEILRGAAIEAVRHWRYQPVLRFGHAVAAYTTALLVRIDPARGGKFSLNKAEEHAADERRFELTERFPRSKEQVLADLEQDAKSANEEERVFLQGQLSKAAWDAGDTDKAARYATEGLSLVGGNPSEGEGGDIVHRANVILGLVALQSGHLLDARKYLLEAGQTPGSPSLTIGGPNMLLAKKLLEIGDRDTVLEYFSFCRRFWLAGQDKLDAWSETVRAGGVPAFGDNLEL